MIVNKNGIIKYEKYWTEEIDVNTKYNEDDYLDLINREFKNSVELRMVSDVPVGAFISGGVDSSAVLANTSIIQILQSILFQLGLKTLQNIMNLIFQGN